MNLIRYINRQIEFSKKTFGPDGRVGGVIDHIKKEIKEVETDPTDLEEWIDLIQLSIDGAWRSGYSAEEISSRLEYKLIKNGKRKWPDWRTIDPDKAIEHIRDEY